MRNTILPIVLLAFAWTAAASPTGQPSRPETASPSRIRTPAPATAARSSGQRWQDPATLPGCPWSTKRGLRTHPSPN